MWKHSAVSRLNLAGLGMHCTYLVTLNRHAADEGDGMMHPSWSDQVCKN